MSDMDTFDYTQPKFVVKRMRYSDGQVVRTLDLNNEQKYLIDRQRRLGELIFTPGVLAGLEVEAVKDKLAVRIAPGTAIDPTGCQIVLAEPFEFDLRKYDRQGPNVALLLTISYRQVEADDNQEGTGTLASIHWHEMPQIEVVLASSQPAKNQITLARLELADGKLAPISYTERQLAGVRLPSLGQPDEQPSLRVDPEGNVNLLTRDSGQPAERLTITGDGKVGVNKREPEATLDVDGSLRVSGATTLSDGLTVSSGATELTQGLTVSGAVTNLDGDLTVNGTTTLNHGLTVSSGTSTLEGNLTVTGNVGIGTTSPTTPLEVKGTARADTIAINGSSQDANGDSLTIGPTDASHLRLGFHTDYSWVQSHGLRPLAINPLGNNVGIGTFAPSARLEVMGDGGMNVDLVVNGRMRSNNNDGGLWVSTDRFVGGTDTNKIGFWNGNAWRLVVANDGNVGIGTTTPGASLDVNGNLRVKGWIMAQDASGNLILSKDGAEVFRLHPDGNIISGGRWLLRDHDPIFVQQQHSGAVLNGTRQGDKSTPDRWHQWTTWRNGRDGDSDLIVVRR